MTIPDYIVVKNSSDEITAYLAPDSDGLKDCFPDTRLNGESKLEFLLPMTCEKWNEITPECKIIAGGREYILLKPDVIDVVRDNQGKRWGKVMAVESWYLFKKDFATINNDPTVSSPATLSVTILSGGSNLSGGLYEVGTAAHALYALLDGTDWSLGTVDVTGTHDLETEKESRLANIKEVQAKWGGLLVWDSENKTVSLRDESTWQNYTGFQIRYSKNLENITKTQNNDIITKLYPFGEDDLDISSVNEGVKYLENYSYTSTVLVGTYENQDISDATELKTEAQKILAEICQPRYNYKVKIVDLRTLSEYSHEDFSLGDIADIIDSDINVDVQARIIRYKYNLFQPWECELELGDAEERFVDKLKTSFDASDFVKDVLKPNSSTNNLLKGIINTFATTINSANGKLVWNDSTLEAIEIDGVGDPTGKRVKLSPGGIGVSTDGGSTYGNAMTGDGILAEHIIASSLHILSVGANGITIDGGLPDSQIESADTWNNSVQKGTLYNKVKITSADGIQILDGSSNERFKAGDLGSNVYGILLKDASGNIRTQTTSDGELHLVNGEFRLNDGTYDRVFIGEEDDIYKILLKNSNGNTVFNADSNGNLDVLMQDGIFSGKTNQFMYYLYMLGV